MTDNEKKAFILSDIAKWAEENANMPVSKEAADGWMRKTILRAGKIVEKYKGNTQEEFAIQILNIYMDSYGDTYNRRFNSDNS